MIQREIIELFEILHIGVVAFSVPLNRTRFAGRGMTRFDIAKWIVTGRMGYEELFYFRREEVENVCVLS